MRLVHAYQTDYVKSGDQFVHLWRFADKADGYMDEVHDLRDEKRADVVVLIVDDASKAAVTLRELGRTPKNLCRRAPCLL